MSLKKTVSKEASHIYFIECLGKVDHAIRNATTVEQLMSDVLQVTLEIISVDRAWLFFPCDPNARNWNVPMEKTVPEFPGQLAINTDVPMDDEVASICREALESDDVVTFYYKKDNLAPNSAKKYSNQSQMHIVLRPKIGNAWLFGVHQCSYPRQWISEDIDLFREIGRRLSDGLNSLLFLRNLQQSESRYRTLLKASPVAIYETDREGNLLYINNNWQELMGVTLEDANNGGWMKSICQHDREKVTKKWLENRSNRKNWELEYRICVKANKTIWVMERATALYDLNDQFTGYLGVNVDITERKEKSDLLSYQASHDDLTGLFNRREFEKRTKKAISTLYNSKSEHALYFLDLDQFKVINDVCGHPAGDELLRQLTQRIEKTISKRDVLARIGGDEFGLLVENCTLDQAYDVATKILNSIKSYIFYWEHKPYQVSISIGLVMINEGFSNLTEILKQADASCYVAKDLGRNRVHVFSETNAEIANRHSEMQWVPQINKALVEDGFELYGQVIESSELLSKKHYEFLLRMTGTDGKVIGPTEFLHAAERYDLITNIDRWVVKYAIYSLKNNSEFVNKVEFVSINLSGASIADVGFKEFVLNLVNSVGNLSKRICFEVTETAVISNWNNAIEFIKEMKNMGCCFALDDFGSGLSSFGYLKNLPMDYLKIDGTFVKNMVNDPIDLAMVKSINEIAHVVGIKTIAEYVENEATKQALKALGVDYYQGYHIARPMPLKDIMTSHC